MKPVLISVLGAAASSVLPEGAVSVANDIDSCTVTDWDTESTKSVMEMSPGVGTCTPARVFLAKPVAEVSIV